MLYIIATPIGNLQDITLRALETLRNADLVVCEDTRRTGLLLHHFEIKKPLVSLHQHTSDEKLAILVERMGNGEEVAYVTDAGTPGIQDPGGKFVAAARAAAVQVVPIPGPSAITALLSVAGIPADEFSFVGYAPTKKGRETFIKKILTHLTPTVFFETSPRLLKLFDQLIALGGAERTLVIGRELTKQFEDIRIGTVPELRAHYLDNPPKGELVITLTV